VFVGAALGLGDAPVGVEPEGLFAASLKSKKPAAQK